VVANATTSQLQRDALINQSEMIMRGAEATVEEPNDLEDIKVRFDRATARLNPELNI
jgi:hypothetical protein